MNDCEHFITNGGVCSSCGCKVMQVEDRKCGGCKNFSIDRFSNAIGSCSFHKMNVTKDMHVTFKIKDGTCFRE